jgi:MraZ protein
VELNTLLGHAPAKVDDKGRLKIPSGFRKIIEDRYGADCFITSIDGDHALVYPMPVWSEIQSRFAKVPSTSVAKKKYLERANFFGQPSSIDAQGRVLIPARLRKDAQIAEDVVVIGETDHLIVWNEEQIEKRMKSSPMTAEDFKELELHGV